MKKSRPKYEITDETMILEDGTIVRRIRALKDVFFARVHAGDLGGWIQQSSNLSQEGDCWVFHNAIVRDNARVRGNAQIHNSAIAKDNALIYEEAWVYENAIIRGHAEVCGHAWVHGDANVGGYAFVGDYANVHGNARLSKNASLRFNAEYYGTSLTLNGITTHTVDPVL